MRCALVIMSCFVVLQSVAGAESPLRISEFAAGGRQGLTDEDGDSPDWIELQNFSGSSVELEGWSLQARRGPAWPLPGTNVPAGEFLVIFASGKDRRVPGRALHVDFKLAARGGNLTLRGPVGAASIDYPRQMAGITFGWSASEGSGPKYNYLNTSTPGKSNSQPIWPGPRVLALEHEPQLPQVHEALTVKATLGDVGAGATVTLRYRIMLDAEREMLMHDDGKHHDGAATDGIYAAVIPAGRAKAGQMIRYCAVAEDDQGRLSRWPLFADRAGYSAYQGTIVADPSIESRLPVLHFFSERAIFYESELYDNVVISEHGQISRHFPKPSFNLKFPVDHRFRYRKDDARVSEVKILGNFADKSKIRNTLAYEMIAAAGSVAHFAFPVRIQQDGRFFCVAEMVEDGDDRWLQRVGHDPKGALYKIYDVFMPGMEAEKKTRKQENRRDLDQFAAAMGEHRPLAERAAYACDHVDVPQCVSYLVAMTLISSGDHGHKNYYLYCDTRGSGQWALLPWDMDLSWGRNWMKTYFDDRLYVDNPLSLYRAGRDGRGRSPLYNLFFEDPQFRQMYLRRLRTVMDEILQTPGTPLENLLIEKRIRALMDQVDPPDFAQSDADLDHARWPRWGPNRSARQEAERIMREHLPGRRNFLFSPRATLFGDRIPEAQRQDTTLQILQIERDAAAAEQYICVTNENAVAVDVSGWRISGAGIGHRFRMGTVLPAGKALYVVSDVNGFRRRKEGPRGGKSLFVQGNWDGTLAKEGMVKVLDPKGRAAGLGGEQE